MALCLNAWFQGATHWQGVSSAAPAGVSGGQPAGPPELSGKVTLIETVEAPLLSLGDQCLV